MYKPTPTPPLWGANVGVYIEAQETATLTNSSKDALLFKNIKDFCVYFEISFCPPFCKRCTFIIGSGVNHKDTFAPRHLGYGAVLVPPVFRVEGDLRHIRREPGNGCPIAHVIAPEDSLGDH